MPRQDRAEALHLLDQDEQELISSDDLSLNGTYQAALRLMRANDIKLIRRPLSPVRRWSSTGAFEVSREDIASAWFRQLLGLLRRGQLEHFRRSRARLQDDFRDVAYDALFQKERGPSSKSLAQAIAAFRAEPQRSGLIAKSHARAAAAPMRPSEVLNAADHSMATVIALETSFSERPL